MVDPVLALVDLDARLSIEDQHLRVDYTITNRTDGPIAVCDELVDRDGDPTSARRRLLVDADVPGTAALVCGSRSPLDTLYYLPSPVFRRVEAGASFTDWRQIPLPLGSWNPAGSMEALPEGITKATLKVDFLTGDATEWIDGQTTGGRALHNGDFHVLTTRPVPIPHH
jgi:hypothetical protein